MSQAAASTHGLLGYREWRERLAEALDHRFFTVDYLDDIIWSGKAWLFANANAALLMEIRIYPTGAKAGAVICAAGDMREIINALKPAAEAHAKANGCICALVESREAWGRLLDDYTPYKICLHKEL